MTHTLTINGYSTHPSQWMKNKADLLLITIEHLNVKVVLPQRHITERVNLHKFVLKVVILVQHSLLLLFFLNGWIQL